jgi:segregation and condensation protein B
MRTEDHHKVEAVLFAVGRDLALEDIAGLCSISLDRTMDILRDLQEEYTSNQNNSLVLHEKGKFWKFTVKDKYLPLVTSLVENTELDKSTMETLAVIAWRYPILQADIIKIRHNKAYDHLKLLDERGFIAKERSGRTYKIKLTPKFFEYFDLPSQDAKEAFRKVIPEDIQKEIVQAEKDIDEKEKEIEELKNKEPELSPEPEKSIEEAASEAVASIDDEDEDDEDNATEEEQEQPTTEESSDPPAPDEDDQPEPDEEQEKDIPDLKQPQE